MSDWFKNPSSEISDEMWRTPTPIQRQADAAVLWAELTGKHASGCGAHGPSKPKKKKKTVKKASFVEKTALGLIGHDGSHTYGRGPKRVNRRSTIISAGGPDVEHPTARLKDTRLTDDDLEVMHAAAIRDQKMNPLKHMARGALIGTLPSVLTLGPTARTPKAIAAATALGTAESYGLGKLRRLQIEGEQDRRRSRKAMKSRIEKGKRTKTASAAANAGKLGQFFKSVGRAVKNPAETVRAVSRNPEIATAAIAAPGSAFAAHREFKPGKNGISRAESKVLGEIATAKSMGAGKKKMDALKKKLSRAKYMRENYAASVGGSAVVGGLSGAALGRGLRKLKRSE